MNRDRSGRAASCAALPLLLAASAAAAQTNEGDAARTGTAAAPTIEIPRVAPAPQPASRATPTPRATASPRPAARSSPSPSPSPRPARTARSGPSATASPTPGATPSPAPSPTPAASSTPVAPPTPNPAPTATAPASNDLARTPAEVESVENPRLWPAVALALAALAGLGYLLRHWRLTRRARLAEEEAARRPQVLVGGAIAPPPAAASPDAAPAPGGEVPTFWTPSRPSLPDRPAPAPVAQPRLTIALHPRRAGLNLVSATADVELTVANEGEGEAAEVTVALALLAGRAGQEEELGQLFAGDPPRPVVPPFALAPGETRTCRTTLVLPRDAIEPIPVGERAMFVPVIAADVRYGRADGGTSQTAAAFVIGAPRAGTDKLSPFWLDAAPRMRDEVEARAHGLSVER